MRLVSKRLGFLLTFLGSTFIVLGQCPDGDQTTFGVNEWRGYVYDGVNTFSSGNYQGEILEPSTIFTESFCADPCNFNTLGSCPVDAETFSVRFKNQVDLACGLYTFEVETDYGARFSINGGSSYLINVSSGGGQFATTVFLSGGSYDFVLDYFHNTGANEISFDYSVLPDDYGGEIAGDQVICDATIDPTTFNSVAGAVFCSGIKPIYQWEESIDDVNWSDIFAATDPIYNVPSGLATGTHYYKRRATDGFQIKESNTVIVVAGTPQGNETTPGAETWNAYAYSGADNYATEDYLGEFTESSTFDESFCGDACNFSINGCDLFTEDFSVRFLSQKTFACDVYDITIGGDDGVRLYIDDELVINGYAVQTVYTEFTERLALDGVYEFRLEYFNVSGANRVRFDIQPAGITETPGVIGGSQDICMLAPIDPAPFTSLIPAAFCPPGTINYQWEESPDGIGSWTDVTGATSETYDIPPGLTAGTYFYRRRADIGGTPIYSNVISVVADSPGGDQTTFGNEEWFGYVYDGANNFTTNYRGYYTENNEFDQDFGGSAVTFPVDNGCDIFTETFSVRYKSIQNFDCGGWEISVGGDDGVRLYIDGELVINEFRLQPYTIFRDTVYLDGNHELILEYYESGLGNRVSFAKTRVNDGVAGVIGSDQKICDTVIDPTPFTNVRSAQFCTGSITYQWQRSPTGTGSWVNETGATGETYNVPSGLDPGTYYYRRGASNDGGSTYIYSNVISVVAQSPQGDENTFGIEEWIGYVYDGENTFNTSNYLGYITEPASFDESFCGNACIYPINGCDLFTETFSIRFKSQQFFECGTYQFTIGGDDGVRLYIDGNLEIDGYGIQLYRTFTSNIYFSSDATHDLVLEYFDRTIHNRVSFNSVFLGPGNGGVVGNDQIFCDPSADPDPFVSLSGAVFCSGDLTPDYQWQESLDGLGWTNISVNGTSETYDVPAGLTTSKFYRRRAQNDDGDRVYSNAITVVVDPPQGDEITYGENFWIGYVYDGRDNYNSSDYLGYFTELTNFDESFCGNACTFPINGCDFFTETFTVRFKNRQTFACGTYAVTIGGDDGVRLSIDGGSTYVLSSYGGLQQYTTLTDTIYFDGTPVDMVLEYYEEAIHNRVSFEAVFITEGNPGMIEADQEFCTAPFDPATITNVLAPVFCSGGTPSYQWQESTDGVDWLDIGGAIGIDYDPPGGQASTRYFRRAETAGLLTLYSNIVTVLFDPPPVSDRFTYGTDEWIGHVYQEVPSSSGAEPEYNESNYIGNFTQPVEFDQDFCGGASLCTFSITGCNLETNNFSIQFRMRAALPAGNYIFTLNSDDGSRLSIDGGPYVVDFYSDHGYSGLGGVSSAEIPLDGNMHEFIIDYYDRTAGQRITFSYTSTPLPVTWYYLNGYHENGQSIIDWKTATELNNSGFDIERSFDGKSFEKIGWVEGNGTSNEMHQYTFIDDLPQHGWNYYRLKQIDYDGKFEYSRLVPVFVDDLPDLQLYPNPMNDHLYLSRLEGDQTPHVTITNVLAQRTWSLQQDPIQPARFQLPQRLEPGVYSVRVTMGMKTTVRKIIVQ